MWSWPLAPVDCSRAIPTNVVLAFFCDETNAFEDICDIIYAPFLNMKDLDGIIKIESLIFCFFKQINKLLGQLDQAIFFASTTVLSVRQFIITLQVMHTKSPRNSPSIISQLHVLHWLITVASFIFLQRPGLWIFRLTLVDQLFFLQACALSFLALLLLPFI